jgi:hypothetical protein
MDLHTLGTQVTAFAAFVAFAARKPLDFACSIESIFHLADLSTAAIDNRMACPRCLSERKTHELS